MTKNAATCTLPADVVTLDERACLWDSVFTVAPLALVGSRDASGDYDFAPKHMVTPLGCDSFFGFVCTPRHATYHNVVRERVFTASFPGPEQIVLASLAAAPRCEDSTKLSLQALPTFEAVAVDGHHVRGSHLYLECELDRVVDGFGDYSLIAGRIVAAHAHPDVLREAALDDQEVVFRAPLLAYLHPGRIAEISRSYSFPYPADFSR